MSTDESSLLGLSRLEPETLVTAFPAPGRPNRVASIAVHADLLHEIPRLCLWESSQIVYLWRLKHENDI